MHRVRYNPARPPHLRARRASLLDLRLDRNFRVERYRTLAPVLRRSCDVPCLIQVLQNADGRTVSVAGRLEQVHVADLVGACAADGGPVVLDLTDLMSADSVALDALHRLRAQSVVLIGLPTYLRFALDDIG